MPRRFAGRAYGSRAFLRDRRVAGAMGAGRAGVSICLVTSGRARRLRSLNETAVPVIPWDPPGSPAQGRKLDAPGVRPAEPASPCSSGRWSGPPHDVQVDGQLAGHGDTSASQAARLGDPSPRGADHFRLWISRLCGASSSPMRASSSPHRLMPPCTSASPDWSRLGIGLRSAPASRDRRAAPPGRWWRNASAVSGSTPSGTFGGQSVKPPAAGALHSFDGARKIAGRKRHIALDTGGRLLMLSITRARISQSTGAQMVPSVVRERWPCISICSPTAPMSGTRPPTSTSKPLGSQPTPSNADEHGDSRGGTRQRRHCSQPSRRSCLIGEQYRGFRGATMASARSAISRRVVVGGGYSACRRASSARRSLVGLLGEAISIQWAEAPDRLR